MFACVIIYVRDFMQTQMYFRYISHYPHKTNYSSQILKLSLTVRFTLTLTVIQSSISCLPLGQISFLLLSTYGFLPSASQLLVTPLSSTSVLIAAWNGCEIRRRSVLPDFSLLAFNLCDSSLRDCIRAIMDTITKRELILFLSSSLLMFAFHVVARTDLWWEIGYLSDLDGMLIKKRKRKY